MSKNVEEKLDVVITKMDVLCKTLNDMNIKSDKMLIALKKVIEKTEGL